MLTPRHPTLLLPCFTAARTRADRAWPRTAAAFATCLALVSHAGLAQSQAGRGLVRAQGASSPLSAHWEGRIGLLTEASLDTSHPSFALIPPAPVGLKLQSLHVLSDYYFAGGFRATAGLVRGPANLPWWPSVGQSASGLNLRLDSLGLASAAWPGSALELEAGNRTVPYVGAGYSTRLSQATAYGAWRFNADLGVISLNSNNISRIGRVLQGDQSADELLRDLRLRPVLKVSVNYAF